MNRTEASKEQHSIRLLRKLISPPIFEDEDETRAANLLNTLLLTTTAATVVVGARASLLIAGAAPTLLSDSLMTLLKTCLTLLVLSTIWFLMRRGHVYKACRFYVAGAWILLTYLAIDAGGVRGHEYPALIVLPIIAGLLLGRRAAVVAGGVTIVTGLMMILIEETGIWQPTFVRADYRPIDVWVTRSTDVVVTATMIYLASRNLTRALENARRANRELETLSKLLSESLREQVSRQTQVLEAILEVSRRLSTILDRDELVTRVVEQVRDAFDLYHVRIYLADETAQRLTLASVTGKAAQEMLTSGHEILWGEGVVGRAAESQEIVFVPNVSQDDDWQSTPLLADTRTEIAVPIHAGDSLLGVLDVHHDVAGGLTQEDAHLFESLANQVGIALQNASLFADAQRRAEQEALVNAAGQNIRRATTLDHVLQVAARELSHTLGARRTVVQLAFAADKEGAAGSPAESDGKEVHLWPQLSPSATIREE